MNPRNALFLSVALTAFVVAVLFGVVTKLTTSNSQAAAAPAVAAIPAAAQDTSANSQAQTDVQAAPAAQPALGPEEAVSLAAKAINRQDVYSVETFSYQGQDSYKVVFSSGDVVYIGMDRQVLLKTSLQATVISVPAVQVPAKNHKSFSNDPQPPSNEHPEKSEPSDDKGHESEPEHD